MRKWFPVLVIAVAAGLYYQDQVSVPEKKPTAGTPIKKPEAKPVQAPMPEKPLQQPSQPAKLKVKVSKTVSPATKTPEDKKPIVLPYVLDEGHVVVQGDIVLGVPEDDKAPDQGRVEAPDLKLWPQAEIPYFIDPSLPDPDRVHQALAQFGPTSLRFVPLSDQKNAIVFIPADGICKSYLGMVGGHQPIWLNRDCGPREVVHEVMHALGFVHEQNRSDRDQFIDVYFDNIESDLKYNFEKLPNNFMKLSGLSKFDFESVMIYPVWMFSRNGQATMKSKLRDYKINPSMGLSQQDIQRILTAYPN